MFNYLFESVLRANVPRPTRPALKINMVMGSETARMPCFDYTQQMSIKNRKAVHQCMI